MCRLLGEKMLNFLNGILHMRIIYVSEMFSAIAHIQAHSNELFTFSNMNNFFFIRQMKQQILL